MSSLSLKSIRFARMITIAILTLLLGYAALVAFVYLRQAKMLYFPSGQIEVSPAEIGLPFDKVTLRTRDGLKLSAWYIPSENAKASLIFCHGNAGNISHRLDSLKIFHDLRLNVLIFDYRGYGESEGEPSENGTYLDAEAAYDYLVHERGVRPSEIIVFGRSLGSAVAAELAARRRAGALIIESGFTSVPELGRKLFPHLPVRLISHFHYATIEKVGRLDLPKLFIHSPADEIIPYEQGRRLFEAAAGPKEFLVLQGGHNEGFLLSGEIYTNGLRRFVSEYF